MNINEYKVVLASGSPRRKEILSQAGVDFVVCPAGGEEIIQSDIPSEIVMQLSYDKAVEVSEQAELRSLIIGADTVVALEGKVLGKPSDEDDAYRMLQSLQGRKHSVFTGVTLLYKGEYGNTIHQFYAETRVKVYPMTEQQIRTYIATGEPMDKAGAYGIQGRFAAYIERIEGDYLNVVGLPLSKLLHVIEEIDVE